MLQTGIINQISLLSGNADLILAILITWSLQEKVRSSWYWAIAAGLLIGFISGLPWWIPLIGYSCAVGISRIFQRRVWQAPLLMTFLVMFIGTLLMGLITMAYLILKGATFSLVEAISVVILPSTLLNLLIVIPVFYLMRDLASWVYPTQVNE